jgi:hypothetical protein
VNAAHLGGFVPTARFNTADYPAFLRRCSHSCLARAFSYASIR